MEEVPLFSPTLTWEEMMRFSHWPVSFEMSMLTNTRGNFGTIVLFNPGVVERVMEILGGPFMAVFMSTDEVLLFDTTSSASHFFSSAARHPLTEKTFLSAGRCLCDKTAIHSYKDRSL